MFEHIPMIIFPGYYRVLRMMLIAYLMDPLERVLRIDMSRKL
jgi:hypothetical protein